MARALIKTASAYVGEIIIFPVGALPATFIACQGQAINRTTYARLFSKISTTYGSGDGVNTFNVPDYQGRFLRGLGDTSGTLGSYQTDDFKQHTHVQDSHNHTQSSHNHTQNAHNHGGSLGTDAHTHRGGVLVDQVFYTGAENRPLVSTTGTRHPYASMVSDTHGHTLTVNSNTPTNIATTATNQSSTGTNQTAGGVETRPKNAAVVFGIRY